MIQGTFSSLLLKNWFKEKFTTKKRLRAENSGMELSYPAGV
jgi:hypothetical protein